MVSVCDTICMLFWLWLLGRFSVDRDLTSCLEPLITDLLLSTISVRMKTREMYAELRPRIPNATLSTFCGGTGISLQNLERAASTPLFCTSCSQSELEDDELL